MNGVEQKRRIEADQSLAKAVAPISETLSSALRAIETNFNAVLAAQEKSGVGASRSLENATSALTDSLSGVLEQIQAVEVTLAAEIKAIPKPKDVVIPKPEKVDLTPILDAIKAIPEVKIPDFPVEKERKTQWEFDVIRNSRTGLIEKVIAT